MDDAGRIKTLLRDYGHAPGVELGDCMEPSIRKDERFLVEKVDASAVKRGDVVVFKRGIKVYAHRVLGKACCCGKIFFITKGDKEERVDYPVSERVFLGRVVGHSKSVSGLMGPAIYALLAVYYINKKVGFRVPLYSTLSSVVCRVMKGG